MEVIASSDFKKFFLLTFTRELIRHSEKKDIITLQKIIETKETQKRVFSPEQPGIFTREVIAPVRLTEKPEMQNLRKPPIKQFVKPLPKQLFIPEPKLPEHLEYLKPVPVAGTELDLFKINPLIRDAAVRIIEANPDERVIVIGTMGTKPTDIFLSREDMDRIISAFSESSKIPTSEGIYRVVVGNLILSAIISETIGSRFIIKKMIVSQNQISNIQQRPTLPFQNTNWR